MADKLDKALARVMGLLSGGNQNAPKKQENLPAPQVTSKPKRDKMPSYGADGGAVLQRSYSIPKETTDLHLPTVQDVLAMNLQSLTNCCMKLGIYRDDFQGVPDMRDAILSHLQKFGSRKRSICSAFATAGGIFKTFAQKRRDFQLLLDDVKQFAYHSETLAVLQSLEITTQKDWIEKGDFELLKSQLQKRPLLLIAGSTSSGKSTLLNAMLEDAILPTSHNAATSAVCIIQHSPDGRMLALLHFESGSQTSVKEVDLQTPRGMSFFEKHVNQSRNEQRQHICVKAEIFMPLEFLRHFTLVDSPGVTEDGTLDSAARQITEQFQKDLACGYIYVLDSTRAAEEAGQAGGLLLAIAKSTQLPPPPDSALFVLNKWDVFTQQQRKKEQQEEFKTKIGRKISGQWRGFRPRQLIPMDAKLAETVRRLGEDTEEMKNLCNGIERILPKGMDNMLLKGLEKPQRLLDVIEQSLETVIRELKLPVEERMKKRKGEWKRLQSFKQSNETGEIAEIKALAGGKMNEYMAATAAYLKSKEGRAFALKWKTDDLDRIEVSAREAGRVKEMAVERFSKTVCNVPAYQGLCGWATNELKPKVDKIMKSLKAFEVDVAKALPDTSSSVAEKTADDISVAAAVAIAVPLLLIGVPLGLALSILVGPLYGIAKLVEFVMDKNFRKAVGEVYDGIVEEVCEDQQMLGNLCYKVVLTTIEPIKIALLDIDERIEDLEKDLEARANQDQEEDLPKFEGLRQAVAKIKGKMGEFILKLDIHEYNAGDVAWPNPKQPIATGSFGSVYRVSIPQRKEVALKVMKNPIDDENADNFLQELRSCRNLRHASIVNFYATVVVEEEPLKLGLVFEWCGGGTLAEEIGGKGFVPGNKAGGFPRSKSIVTQILNALQYIHEKGVIHRDLKPENVMMSSRKLVKVGDLGLAKDQTKVTGTFCGTLFYMAPEVILRRPYSTSADIFSVGIMMWELWNGKRAYSQYLSKLSLQEFLEGVLQETIRPGGFVCQSADMEAKIKLWKSLAESCWATEWPSRPRAEKALEVVSKM
eukprot:m.130843 g.130843  ORF g.130843 m.130843 type:complete len:1041 (+) comp38038_c0_seq20:318-3440(+)